MINHDDEAETTAICDLIDNTITTKFYSEDQLIEIESLLDKVIARERAK